MPAIYLFLEDQALLRAEGEALQALFTFGAAEAPGWMRRA